MRFPIKHIGEKLGDKTGQATVEAAFMIPVLLTVVLLLIQPAIVCYDLVVMKSACAEACRLASEPGSNDEGYIQDFVKRKLSAVPQAEIFHMHDGGCSWDVKVDGIGSKTATVTVKNKLKVLPLIDVGLHAFGALGSNGELEIQSSSTQTSQPGWV